MNTVFLSASVPVPGRGNYYDTSEPFLIHAAVRSLVIHVLNTNRRIVWGGHPAVTPMVWAVCESLSKDYAQHFTLYQSKLFADVYPESNKRFKNVCYTDRKEDLGTSLLHMRHRMLRENEFEAGVFVGGMEGLEAEYSMFHEEHAFAKRIVVASTGGAALQIARAAGVALESENDIDYGAMFSAALP